MFSKGYALNSIRIVIPLLALALSACGTLDRSPVPTKAEQSEGVNASLEAMSKLFAKAVTDADVRLQVQRMVAERFDGDTNVLYRTLTAKRSNHLHQSLARQGATLSEMDRLAGTIPRLQVAVPAHFEAWNAKTYVPLVGYAPMGEDDKALKTVRAFDAQGNLHLLDAHTLPQKPVIILSQNERTDDTGKLRAAYSSLGKPSNALNPSQVNGCRSVYVRSIRLYDDYEPWSSGAPEIMLSATSSYTTPGLSYGAGFTYVDSENVTYNVNRYIGCTPGDVSFQWWEDDGTWSGADHYGTITVPYHLFDGYTSTFYLTDMQFATN